MSVHIELTPEAAARLRAQQRNSTIASLLISILSLVLVGMALAFIAMKVLVIEQPDIVTYQAIAPPEDDIQTKEITPTLTRQQSAPSSATAKVIASQSLSATAIPVPDITPESFSSDFGDGDDFGAGWGQAEGAEAGAFSSIPADMRKRCSKADRLARLADNGGNEQCEEAVLSALRWLKKNQKNDGSWGKKKPVAMTGLAVLAYLGRCETPLSEEFGDSVQNGIVYLVNNNLKQKGKSTSDLMDRHWVYEHAIAMYALSEAYTFCSQLKIEDTVPGLRDAVEKGTQWIIKNQTRAGGWDYSYNLKGRPGDSSIVAWHMQALKAAKATGIKFNGMNGAINKGLGFLEDCQAGNGGFGYQQNKRPVGSRKHFSLTSAGTLCFQQHKGANNSIARKGIDYLDSIAYFDLEKPSKLGQKADFYEHYYTTQAMINHGGKEWDKYNNLFRDRLLKAQNKDGSWAKDGGQHNKGQDPVYYTALATLMLEVYYRFLPGTNS